MLKGKQFFESRYESNEFEVSVGCARDEIERD